MHEAVLTVHTYGWTRPFLIPDQVLCNVSNTNVQRKRPGRHLHEGTRFVGKPAKARETGPSDSAAAGLKVADVSASVARLHPGLEVPCRQKPWPWTATMIGTQVHYHWDFALPQLFTPKNSGKERYLRHPRDRISCLELVDSEDRGIHVTGENLSRE